GPPRGPVGAGAHEWLSTSDSASSRSTRRVTPLRDRTRRSASSLMRSCRSSARASIRSTSYSPRPSDCSAWSSRSSWRRIWACATRNERQVSRRGSRGPGIDLAVLMVDPTTISARGELDPEGRSVPLDAVHPHGPAVRLRDVTDDGQPKAGAAAAGRLVRLLLGAGPIDLVEALEDPLLVRFG